MQVIYVEYSGVLDTKNLAPGRAIYYAWQEPMRRRALYWTTTEHFEQMNRLREVRFDILDLVSFCVSVCFLNWFLVPGSSVVEDTLGDTNPRASPVLRCLLYLVPSDPYLLEILADDSPPVLTWASRPSPRVFVCHTVSYFVFLCIFWFLFDCQ